MTQNNNQGKTINPEKRADKEHKTNSEVANENIKYIKMLELQRSVLKKLIKTNK